jgi:hypothetical protein
MANEVRIIELRASRGAHDPIREMPPVTTQNVSVGGNQSAAFKRSTTRIMIRTSVDCTLEFGVDPAGGTDTVPIKAAEGWHDFGVLGGHKVWVV